MNSFEVNFVHFKRTQSKQISQNIAFWFDLKGLEQVADGYLRFGVNKNRTDEKKSGYKKADTHVQFKQNKIITECNVSQCEFLIWYCLHYLGYIEVKTRSEIHLDKELPVIGQLVLSRPRLVVVLQKSF